MSTVTRMLRKTRAQGESLVSKIGRPNRARIPFALTKRREPVETVEDAQVDEVYRALRHTPFPYPEPCSPELLAREKQSLHTVESTVVDSVIRPWSLAGIRLCNAFFPNRFIANRRNTMSALEAWRDEKILRRAIKFQLQHGDPVTPRRVLRAVTLLCRTPTIFRPAIAKCIYQRYAHPGAVVWDPCSGYGGRLLGAFAAGVHYIGTDVEPETIEGNRRLAKVLGASHELFVTPAESFDPPPVDLVFTSPPYFDRERYSTNKNQSWQKYSNLEEWTVGFLRPIAEAARRALHPTRFLVLNVANFRNRNETIPIVDRTLATVLESGFVHVETLLMPLAAINRRAPTEPILVFQTR